MVGMLQAARKRREFGPVRYYRPGSQQDRRAIYPPKVTEIPPVPLTAKNPELISRLADHSLTLPKLASAVQKGTRASPSRFSMPSKITLSAPLALALDSCTLSSGSFEIITTTRISLGDALAPCSMSTLNSRF